MHELNEQEREKNLPFRAAVSRVRKALGRVQGTITVSRLSYALFRLGEMARRAAAAGIRRRHPDYDERRVRLAPATLLYGDDLVRRAWPDREPAEP